MISLLEGKIEFRGERFCILSAGGVGYKIYAAPETLKKIPEKADFVKADGVKPERAAASRRTPIVKLWTHLYVREDAMELYGFLTYAELEFFETLIHIPGIGPKSALGIMAIAPLDTLKKAIAAGDTSYLTRVSGIGRKTAEKIVLELKEKMAGKGAAVDAPELKEEADALEALISLGYSHRDAREALAGVPREIKSVEKRVGEALKRLGKR